MRVDEEKLFLNTSNFQKYMVKTSTYRCRKLNETKQSNKKYRKRKNT